MSSGGPIFIVGPMGSGTTLLRLKLDSHENIAIPHETGFMRIYNSMRFVPFKLTGRGWARRLGWSDEELDEEARQFFDRIFARYASQHGKPRWGEKTPQHTWHISAMKRLFPDAMFIGIVRHPGAAVRSNTRRFRHPLWKASYHYRRYAMETARQASRHPRRMVIVRYEDLVLNGEAVMRELLAWLGEPWSERVLEHHVIQSERDHLRVEGKVNVDEPVDPARISNWTTTMPEHRRAEVRRRLTRLGEFFGYSFDDPNALEPLDPSGSLLLRGPALDARIDRFADIGIRTRMPVPLQERPYDPREVELHENEQGARYMPTPPSRRRRAARRAVGVLPTPARRQVARTSRALRRLVRRLRWARGSL